MFHMIEQPKELLSEFSRLIKINGIIIIGKEHQKTNETRQIIENHSNLQILQENERYIKCGKID